MRFRYCSACQRPVAKRNFSSRHNHPQEDFPKTPQELQEQERLRLQQAQDEAERQQEKLQRAALLAKVTRKETARASANEDEDQFDIAFDEGAAGNVASAAAPVDEEEEEDPLMSPDIA